MFDKIIVTHLPSGESARVDRRTIRSMFHLQQAALRMLRDRLWAAQNNLGRSERQAGTDLTPGDERPKLAVVEGRKPQKEDHDANHAFW